MDSPYETLQIERACYNQSVRINVLFERCRMSHLLKFSLNSKIPIELIYMKSEQDFSQRRVNVRKIYDDRIVVYCMMRN